MSQYPSPEQFEKFIRWYKDYFCKFSGMTTYMVSSNGLGIRSTVLNPHEDSRGSLTELYRNDMIKNCAQSMLSISKPGVIRGWHKHKNQKDYIVCIKGTIEVWSHDDGNNSGKVIIKGSEPELVEIPEGMWHATRNVGNEDAWVIYFVTQVYDYMKPDEERLDVIQ